MAKVFDSKKYKGFLSMSKKWNMKMKPRAKIGGKKTAIPVDRTILKAR